MQFRKKYVSIEDSSPHLFSSVTLVIVNVFWVNTWYYTILELLQEQMTGPLVKVLIQNHFSFRMSFTHNNLLCDIIFQFSGAFLNKLDELFLDSHWVQLNQLDLLQWRKYNFSMAILTQWNKSQWTNVPAFQLWVTLGHLELRP